MCEHSPFERLTRKQVEEYSKDAVVGHKLPVCETRNEHIVVYGVIDGIRPVIHFWHAYAQDYTELTICEARRLGALLTYTADSTLQTLNQWMEPYLEQHPERFGINPGN